uniref:Uncharacterized protein n=1 Tax=Phytophthora fragariae TaxID=53985 RepID=A0A6A3DZW1_9STRA|nr:hypothetical protein PF009_g23994 [Phytophthora fragariae]
MGEMVPDSAESETTYSQEGRATDASQPNPDADEIMLSAEGTVSSSYIGSSPPSQPRSWTTTQDLACPFSLQSDGEALQPQMEVETQAQPECGGSLPVHGEGGQRHRQPEEPTLSQDGFSLEQTKVAPGMPQQLPTFLIPFQGSLTTVPQNGQCAYAALYATMTTTTETALHFTADVVKGGGPAQGTSQVVPIPTGTNGHSGSHSSVVCTLYAGTGADGELADPDGLLGGPRGA